MKAEACLDLGVYWDALSTISKELVSWYVSNLLLEKDILQNVYYGYSLVNMETIYRITFDVRAVFLNYSLINHIPCDFRAWLKV